MIAGVPLRHDRPRRSRGWTTAPSTSTTACWRRARWASSSTARDLTDAMARGYYKDPEATVEAFRNFMFHTGDVGYRRRGGPRALPRPHAGPDPPPRRERLAPPSSSSIALGHPAVVEAAAFGVPGEFGEHEVKLDVVERRPDDLDSPSCTPGWPRACRASWSRATSSCATAFPKTPSERVQKYKLTEAEPRPPRGPRLRAGAPCADRSRPSTPTSRPSTRTASRTSPRSSRPTRRSPPRRGHRSGSPTSRPT